MNDDRKARFKQGLTLGGVALAGLLVVQGISPCGLAQRCSTSGNAESETSARPDSASPDDVLVTVNGQPITRAEVDEELEAALGVPVERIPESQRGAVRVQWTPRVLEMLVARNLLEQEAEAEKVTVSEEELAAEIERVSADLPEDVTLADLKHRLGLSDEEWTDALRKQARIERLLEAHGVPGERPSAAEVESFYADNGGFFEVPTMVEARHILIATTAGDDEAARSEKQRRAQEIRERLTADNAPSFEAVATEASDCPSATEGGSLGSFARGQMEAAFEEAAFGQEPGAVGPVVETSFGYHIIKVENRTEGRVKPLEEVRDAIAQHLHAKRRDDAVRAYVDQLRAEASIQNVRAST